MPLYEVNSSRSMKLLTMFSASVSFKHLSPAGGVGPEPEPLFVLLGPAVTVTVLVTTPPVGHALPLGLTVFVVVLAGSVVVMTSV